ncbi:hypothetical protein EDC01DRAFT_190235 [Geopyxis carbonaria]|nr:hypothetical protein EDC01DRAFT_190235 [Geopyxis carbonaria]
MSGYYHAITIHNSDGAGEGEWPKDRTPQSPTNFNYHRLIAPGEPKDELWRIKVASGIIEALDPTKNPIDYMLDKIPEGYALMEHTKSQNEGAVRKDTYLFGHPQGKKFRSPAEFIPHAIWLEAQMMDGPMHEKYGQACACGNCTGTSKRNGATPREKKQTPRKPLLEMDDVTSALTTQAREERIRETTTDDEGEGEQETAGWTFRKGELVWIYLGNPDDIENNVNLPMTGGSTWGAGIVIKKPMYAQKMLRGPDPDDPSSGTSDDDKYSIQLCSATSENTDVRSSIPQFVLRPWLSRPFEIPEPLEGEHESVVPARKIARTFTLFERLTEKGSTESAINFAGLFLGAEKIFVGEPVRIVSVTGKPLHEDVLVVGQMILESEPSKAIPAGGNVTRSKKTQVVMFHGTVYTSDPETPGIQKCTPQMTVKLPHRMRRSDRTGKRIQWYKVREGAQYSMKNVLGRYYEPYPVDVWMANYDAPMGRKEVKQWVTQRIDALGFAKIGDVQILNKADKRRPVPATLVSDTVTDGDEDPMDIDQPPTLNFAAINDAKHNMGSASKSRMALAAAGDRDDIEEFSDGEVEEADDGVPGSSVLAKSPTKRIALR